jgi:hypothetical protein
VHLGPVPGSRRVNVLLAGTVLNASSVRGEVVDIEPSRSVMNISDRLQLWPPVQSSIQRERRR